MTSFINAFFYLGFVILMGFVIYGWVLWDLSLELGFVTSGWVLLQSLSSYLYSTHINLKNIRKVLLNVVMMQVIKVIMEVMIHHLHNHLRHHHHDQLNQHLL